ncbi:MAG: hypothetical protein J6A88_06040 [Oscillospiraceae bacterium]|nr:hypothetical protein [Oscillospiraceae bacterium]
MIEYFTGIRIMLGGVNLVVIVEILALVILATLIIRTLVKKKKNRPLSIEDKITMLNTALADGKITEEEYKKQKAELLKNL